MFRAITARKLSKEQSEAVERAAYLIIKARQEAAEILQRAGIELPEDGGFGTPCSGHFDAGLPCGCNKYTGEGEPCRTRVTTDSGFPPTRGCGHKPSEHLPT